MKKKRWMKRIAAGILAATVCFTAMSWDGFGTKISAAAANLITNGGFETADNYWPSQWTCNNPSNTFGVSTDATTEGSNSLKFWDENSKELWITQQVTIQKDGIYEFSAWAKGSAKIALAIGESGKQNETAINDSGFTEIKNNFELTAGTYYVSIVATTEAGGWGYIDSVSLTESDGKTESVIVYERDFSGTNENLNEWTVNQTLGTNKIEANCWSLWNGEAIDATLTTTVSDLSEGTYYLSVTPEGEKMKESTIQINDGTAKTLTINKWGKGVENKTDTLELSSASNITIKINLSFDSSGWINFNNIKLVKKVTPAEKYDLTWAKLQALLTEATSKHETDYTAKSWSTFSGKLTAAQALVENTATISEIEIAYKELLNAQNALEAPIWVKKVDGLSDNFIRGVDISSYVSITQSGATFKDFEGNVLDDAGFFKLLKDSGVNYVRIKIWNDPYDNNKKGYGGGNSDLEKAKILGKLATDQGMGVLINFHYSDFWADPERQYAPKAWKNMTVEQKETALYNFTKESLQELKDAGVKTTMVQVGNETNNGIAGENREDGDWTNMCKLFSAGCQAVKDFDSTILRAVHFTDPQTVGNFDNFAKQLKDHNVDYDVFAASYYPNIHGTMENITAVLKNIVEKYGKKVMVAETDWAWTTKDGDGHGNSFKTGNDPDYSVSVQGEANEIRDVIQAVHNVGTNALGVFVWEPAWIPVQNVNNSDGTVDSAKVASNKVAWETYGSGWASSYSKDYDPKHGGAYYGGSVKDNNGFFDFDGNPLEVLTIFKDVYTGKTGSTPQVDVVKQGKIDVKAGTVTSAIQKAKAAIPTTVVARLTDGNSTNIPVAWESTVMDTINDFGIYEMSGTATYTDSKSEQHTYAVTCTVSVMADSILTNGGFESGKANWTVTNTSNAELKWNDTQKEGTGALHFYDNENVEFQVSQEVTIPKTGNYRAYMYLQGGDGSDNDEIYIQVKNKTTNQCMRDVVLLKGWKNWQKALTDTVPFTAGEVAEITISASCVPGAWGSFDEVYFYDNESAVEHAHTYTLVEEKAADCMVDGYKEHYICKRCVGLFSDEQGTTTTEENLKLPARGSHDLTLHEAVAASYSAAGNKKYYECKDCHRYFEDEDAKKEITDKSSVVIPKLISSGNNSSSTPTTPPTNTKPDNTTETKPDGSTVETTTETKSDGTKVETVTETAKDGSKTETVVETKADGTKVETVTETATDGSKVETKKESETNTAGKQVDVATVTKTDADGSVTSVVEMSTINEIAENTTATVTVKKDGEGAVSSATASVAATIEGKKTSLSADVIAQVQEASGQKDVAITVTAKNDEGKTLYKVKVDTKDLTAKNALYIYKVDSKTGELVMVNSKTYKVDENGGLDISIKNKATYELMSKEEAKAVEKQIKATVKVQNSSKDVKKGKTTKVAFDKKMNMNNVKSITYSTANKKVATVSKSGKVTAKAKGTVTVKATVTLKNGSKKTVTMKIKVK